MHKFSVENVFNKNLMWNCSSAESFFKESNSGIFILYLVSVLVPIPSADALVSLLTAYEEQSHQRLSPRCLHCGSSAPAREVLGKHSCAVLLEALLVGFFKQTNHCLLLMKRAEGLLVWSG